MGKQLGILFLLTCLADPSVAVAQLAGARLVPFGGTPIAYVADPAVRGVFYHADQSGLVGVVTTFSGQAVPTPNAFIDLRTVVSTSSGGGLLGMAFPPDAATSGHVFFSFTDLNGDLVVARFNRTFPNLQFETPRAILGTRLDLRWSTGLRVIPQEFDNNKGGHLAFGPDGYLHIGVGDGGGGNDPLNNAQNPDTLLGKMLRIDVDVPAGDPNGFRIPDDNPFVDGDPIKALPEIWSLGWRHPSRFSFDDFGDDATGALIVGDMGEQSREEIDYEPKGAGGRNYGWRIREGTIATPGVPPTTPAYLPLTEPIYDYPRPEGFAVVGGFVYRGSCLPAKYRGRYFFADNFESRVWSIGLTVEPVSGEATATDVIEHTAELGGPAQLGRITGFTRDSNGELYLTSFSGYVVQIVPSPAISNPPCRLQAVVSVNDVVLSWEPPFGGSSHYVLEAGTAPGASNLGSALLTETAVSVTSVPVGTYYARVRSLAATGLSAPSNDLEVVVRGRCLGPPPKPVDVGFRLSASVTVSWSIPGTEDGPTMLSIEAGSAPGLADLGVIPLGPTARSIVVSGVPPGKYLVRVRTHNACGTSVSEEYVINV